LLVPPQIARVHLWERLPLPPIQRIDGERPDVVADVVIETEHVVWTLLAESARNDLIHSHLTAALVDAGAWFAGARQHFCGVLECSTVGTSPGSVLRTRYARSRDSARLRSATRGPATPARVQWGVIRWAELGSVLQDYCDASNLPAIERALARNALDWLIRVGIGPEVDDLQRAEW